MGLLDELKKLARPYDDDEDEFEKVANYFDELFDSEVDYDA